MYLITVNTADGNFKEQILKRKNIQSNKIKYKIVPNTVYESSIYTSNVKASKEYDT